MGCQRVACADTRGHQRICDGGQCEERVSLIMDQDFRSYPMFGTAADKAGTNRWLVVRCAAVAVPTAMGLTSMPCPKLLRLHRVRMTASTSTSTPPATAAPAAGSGPKPGGSAATTVPGGTAVAASAPLPELPAGVEAEAALLAAFSEAPTVSKAVVRSASSSGVVLTVSTAARRCTVDGPIYGCLSTNVEICWNMLYPANE